MFKLKMRFTRMIGFVVLTINTLKIISPGALLADCVWGRYKTILVISSLYIFGTILQAVTSIPLLTTSWYGPIVAFIIIGFGAGW